MKKHLFLQSITSFLLIGILSGCTLIDLNVGKEQIPDNAVVVTEGTGQVVDFLEKPVKDYIEAMKSVPITGNDYCFNDEAGAGVSVADFWDGQTYSARSKSVYLSWAASVGPYTVSVAKNENFEGATEYQVANNGLNLPNLNMATTYYWKVEDGRGKVSSVNSFVTEDTVRFIDSGMVVNVRDLGGRMTNSGKRVKQGLIYRGAEMNIQSYTDQNGSVHNLNLRKHELDLFKNELNIKTEIDFRTDAETNSMTRSPLGDDVTYYRPAIGGYTSMFCKHSSNGADNPEMREMYRNILLTLAQATEDSAVYYHCWGGADRTGTISFIVNGLLGVSYTDLLIDFELTTFSCNFRSREDNPTYYNYFNSMVTQLKDNYQKSEDETISTVMERYMKECLYLTDADISALKTNLLEK